VIESGFIANQNTGLKMPYHMRLLEEESIADMLQLQEKVLSHGHFDLLWFYPFNEEELIEIIAVDSNLVLGIFIEQDLVAFRVGCRQGREYDEITGALGPPYTKTPCFLMNGVFVDPAYQGNHLQQKMSAYSVRQCERQGIRTFLTAIHPDNVPSIKSLENIGFIKKKRTLLYHQKYDRVILVKE
jgi:GNAT superfamily N-acetyltransferase